MVDVVTPMDYGKTLTCFFQEYLLFPKDRYRDDGTLTVAAMIEAVDALLENEVFDSPDDMKRQALIDHGMLLPDELFERGCVLCLNT